MSGPLLQDDTSQALDGSRPLIVGRPHPSLAAAVNDSRTPIECFASAHARSYRAAPPRHCRRTIAPGEHHLTHTELDQDGRARPGRTTAYCAPCAVRDGRWWDVTEATP